MSKAVLVIDMPKSCSECSLYVCYTIYAGDPGDKFCSVTNKTVNPKKKFNGCPLQSVPEKKEIYNPDSKVGYNSGYSKGYNDCIEEILKGCD